MTDLDVREYSDYDEFVREWHASDLDELGVSLEEARGQGRINEDDTRLRWQLLGQLDDEELLIEIPEWLAEEKVGFVDGATPTEFVGRIERETEQAILFGDSASAKPLTKLAHRIHQLEQDNSDADRDEWLANRLEEHRQEFEQREDAVELQEEWLPKSQLIHIVRRE
jgi:hypothetical protein